MSFGQFASSTQFYLYGKKYCTKTGWEAASNQYAIPDLLSDIDLSGNVYIGMTHELKKFMLLFLVQ